MTKVDNENMCMIPLDQCGMTFNELNDRCWKSFLKKEVKHFVKMEKEWMQRTIFEKQNALEVYPCARKFYKQEPLNCKDYIIKVPSTTEKEGTKRFRLLFNLMNFDSAEVKVVWSCENSGLLVEVKHPEQRKSSLKHSNLRQAPLFVRFLTISSDIDMSKLKASMASDKLLLIEAPLVNETLNQNIVSEIESSENNSQYPPTYSKNCGDKVDIEQEGRSPSFIKFQSDKKNFKPTPPNQLFLNKKSLPLGEEGSNNESEDLNKNQHREIASSKGESPKTVKDSSSKSPSDTSSGGKEMKVGVPIFRDERNVRRMYLTVDIGSEFTRNDVIVKIIKENRIQINAKHKVKDGERENKTKFRMNYELGEKVDPFSLKAGLMNDNKLVVTALAKQGLRERINARGDLSADIELSCDDSKDCSDHIAQL